MGGSHACLAASSRSERHKLVQVKVICNSGGQFVRMEGGAVEYQGGETRLVSVRSSCTLKELLASLERVMAYQRRSGSLEADKVLLPAHQPPKTAQISVQGGLTPPSWTLRTRGIHRWTGKLGMPLDFPGESEPRCSCLLTPRRLPFDLHVQSLAAQCWVCCSAISLAQPYCHSGCRA